MYEAILSTYQSVLPYGFHLTGLWHFDEHLTEWLVVVNAGISYLALRRMSRASGC
jgi:uncharacterized membrane protein (GlpM family)